MSNKVYGVKNYYGEVVGDTIFNKEDQAIDRAIDMTHQSFRNNGIGDRLEKIERTNDNKEYLKRLQSQSSVESFSVKELKLE